MNPEDKARQQVDRQLSQCGWAVQDYKAINITAAPGVAVREFPLETGRADYLLYADGRVIGTVEAKSKGHTLIGVHEQSSKYNVGLPKAVPQFQLPRPVRCWKEFGLVKLMSKAL